MSHFHLYQEPTLPDGLIEKFRETFPVKTMDMLSKEFDLMYSQMTMRQNGKFVMTLQRQQQFYLRETIREVLGVTLSIPTPYREHIKPLMPQYWQRAPWESWPWLVENPPGHRTLGVLNHPTPVNWSDTDELMSKWLQHVNDSMGVDQNAFKNQCLGTWPATKLQHDRATQKLRGVREDADDVYPRKYRTRPFQ